MAIRQVNAIAVIFQLIITLIILQGCSRVIAINPTPNPSPTPQKKYNMDVAFVHTNELKDYSYIWPLPGAVNPAEIYFDELLFNENINKKTSYRYISKPLDNWTIKMENSLIKNAENILQSRFNKVVTIHLENDDHYEKFNLDHKLFKDKATSNTLGIIKLQSPEVSVFHDCNKPELSIQSCNYANELTAEWVFEDLAGNRIWSSKIVGYGIEDFAVFDSLKTKIGKPLKLGIDDHFKNLADALDRSPEIRLFESCLKVDCKLLLNDPSLLSETLNRIENKQERKQIAHRLIYMSIEKENIGLLNELLSMNYININRAEEYYQILPIHSAAKCNNLEAVRLLIDNKSNINTGDNNGWTPLHYAASNGYTEITKLLIEKRADIDIKNSDGQTPFNLAITNGHEDDWQLLLNNGATYYVIDNNDLLGTAFLYNKIGYYFAEKKEKVKSTETLKVSSDYYRKAASRYNDMSKKAGKKALLKEVFGTILLSFVIVPRPDVVHDVALGTQQRAKQYAEFKALIDAKNMKLSPIKTLDLAYNYTKEAINPNVTMVTGGKSSFSDMFKTTNFRDIEKYFSELSEICYKSSNEVQEILKCYEEKGNTTLAVAPLPQAQIERSEEDTDFTTINLLDHTYHMGDNNVSGFESPKPQGIVFEGRFNITDTNLSTIFITIWVSDLVPKNHKQFLRGYYKTKLLINHSEVGILNNHISGIKDKSKIEQITIGVNKNIIKKGYNEIKIIAGYRRDKNNYDDFQIHQIIVRHKE